MIQALKKYKYALIGVVAFAGIAYVYVNYFSTPDIEPLVRGGGEVETTTVDRELLVLLSSLQSIELDDAVLQSPTFESLEDFSRELVPEPIGRTNPFDSFNASAARNPR